MTHSIVPSQSPQKFFNTSSFISLSSSSDLFDYSTTSYTFQIVPSSSSQSPTKNCDHKSSGASSVVNTIMMESLKEPGSYFKRVVDASPKQRKRRMEMRNTMMMKLKLQQQQPDNVDEQSPSSSSPSIIILPADSTSTSSATITTSTPTTTTTTFRYRKIVRRTKSPTTPPRLKSLIQHDEYYYY